MEGQVNLIMDKQEEMKSVLERFHEKLDLNEKELIKDYLSEKTLESLARCFDNLIEENNNEIKTD